MSQTFELAAPRTRPIAMILDGWAANLRSRHGAECTPHPMGMRVRQPQTTIDFLRDLLACLTAVCRQQLVDAPLLPLGLSRIRYRREPDGKELWQSAIVTHALGHGDCEDLSALLAAELQLAGEAARAEPVLQAGLENGRPVIHIIVQRPDGSVLDPSLAHGMH